MRVCERGWESGEGEKQAGTTVGRALEPAGGVAVVLPEGCWEWTAGSCWESPSKWWTVIVSAGRSSGMLKQYRTVLGTECFIKQVD